MDKLTAIKIRYPDGTYSDQILISVLAENVKYDKTRSLTDILNLLDNRINQIGNPIISEDQRSWQGEVADIRTGYNGINYQNAGNAVRKQITDLNAFLTVNNSETMSTLIKQGVFSDNDILFTLSDVSIGDTIYYDLDATTGLTGQISLYNENDVLLTSYGKTGSSTQNPDHVEGYFIIPSTFSYAKLLARKGTTSFGTARINWLAKTYIGENKELKQLIDNSLYTATNDKDETLINEPFYFRNVQFEESKKIFLKSENTITSYFFRTYNNCEVEIHPGNLYAKIFVFKNDRKTLYTKQSTWNNVKTTLKIPYLEEFNDVGCFICVSFRKNAEGTIPITTQSIEDSNAEILLINNDVKTDINLNKLFRNSFFLSFDRSPIIRYLPNSFANIYLKNNGNNAELTYNSHYLLSPLLTIKNGESITIDPKGLYAKAFILSDMNTIIFSQSSYSNSTTSFTSVADGFVCISFIKNSTATEDISVTDLETNNISIELEHSNSPRIILKRENVNFDNYSYLSFSSGVMYEENEIHVLRAANSHMTDANPENWGKLIFFIIDDNQNITHLYFNKPENHSFNFELRDPNLSITRNNKIILSGFGTNEAEEYGSYMYMLSYENNSFTIEDFLYNYVPSNELPWGNVVQDKNGYIYKCTYGGNNYKTINLYKSNTIVNNELPNSFSIFASYTSNTNCSEPTISIINDEKIIVLIRKENTGPTLLQYDFNGTLLSESTIGTTIFHAPVLLPYYTSNHILYGASGNFDNQTLRRPIIGYLDIINKDIIFSKYIENTNRRGGYCSLVPLGGDNYGCTYYKDAVDSSYSEIRTSVYYKKINVKKFLNSYYI